MKKILFLVSGNGGNLKFFFLARKNKILKNFQLNVVADRGCRAIDFAMEQGLEHNLIGYKRTKREELIYVLEKVNPDVIVTNWHKIIDEETVREFQGKMINLHYSLLPAFNGLIGIEPIRRAYKRGCMYIGPTCHFIDEGVDTGKIISQAIFKTNIPINDAVEVMFKNGCHVLLNGVQQVIGKTLISRYVTQHGASNQNCMYSPGLDYDVQLFSEKFWTELAHL